MFNSNIYIYIYIVISSENATTRHDFYESEDIHNIYNIDESKSYNIKNHRYTDDHYHNKKQFITNNLTNYITKRNSITNNEK